MSAIKTATTIDLIELSTKIEGSATSLKNKCLQNGKAINLPASKLAKKVPELKVLGDICIFRCMVHEEYGFTVSPLQIHLNDDGIPQLFDCDLNPLEAKIISYKINPEIVKGSAIVELSALSLEVGLHLNFESSIDLKGQGIVEGEGLPPVELLDQYPEIICKLSNFEFHTPIKILEKQGESRKYQNPLFKVECQGKVYRNVVSNVQMNEGYAKYGDGSVFKIIGSKKVKDNQKFYLLFEDDVNFEDL